MQKIGLLLLLLIPVIVLAQPANDNCGTAITLTDVVDFCSNEAQYTNVGATSSNIGPGSTWTTEGRDVWFRFTAQAYDVNITVSGNVNGSGTLGGTMQSPLIALYSTSDCTFFLERIGSVSTSAGNKNVTTLYKGGITIGQIYYIRVSAENNNMGTFKLCVNNYNPILQSGQDNATASILCSKEGFTQNNVTGAGTNNRESVGTCLDNVGPGESIEANTAWYKWTAANNGALTFTIKPTVSSDDLDWVLYDLGTSDNPIRIAIRCASGSGVDCSPRYDTTGLSMSSVDLNEQPGCVSGQDGFVRYVDMIQGHVYALLINNFSNGNNGFALRFGGAGDFLGPQAAFSMQQNQPCTVGQSFTFASQSTNYARIKWTFGEGASQDTSALINPGAITYSTPGIKTVVLQAYSSQGCFVVAYKTFTVGVKPATPTIAVNKPTFCLLDTIQLSTTPMANTTYLWTGPNNFTSDQASISIPINNNRQVAGIYTLIAIQGNCNSDPATIIIPPILNNPVAAFRTIPTLPAKLSMPVTIEFYNQSTNADSYLWDFGDETTSTDTNPKHEYTAKGEFEVTLIAFKNDICSGTVTKGTFVITDNVIFIPNTFTPNGDGVNDEFVITVSNLRSYHIRIFNRWGQPVFEGIDIFDNWKGLYNGEPLPVGTYYYVIDGESLNGTSIKKAGAITILR